ncbi:MAG: hypothetical protein Pars92KO_17480 [Parasphingorhabdus sp.]
MRALEELPDNTKNRLLPFIPLRPWVGAHRLQNTINRIEEAYGDRPIVVGVGEREEYQDRPVFNELESLRTPDNGFERWVNFIISHDNYIPVAQLNPSIEDETRQIQSLWNLNRGLVINLPAPTFPAISAVAERVGSVTEHGVDTIFVLDFGIASPDHLLVAAQVQGYVQSIREHCNEAFVSVSASSFPSGFDNLTEQPIYERRLFNQLVGHELEGLIYSDRGSARIERGRGGGGLPYPRIDYPLLTDWRFYRHHTQSGFAGYQAQATLLSRTDYWNPNIRVWGTQMIERTIAGDQSAISNPQKSTAARINLHLQKQTFYDDPEAAEDTEDDWED